MAEEGTFTQAGGGSQVFLDRIKTQEEIQKLLDEVFGSRKRLSYEEYMQIVSEISSEMFLSLIILLQSSLPCSENFTRYKNNYEKYQDGTGDGPRKEEVKVKQIASPKFSSNLSPLSQMGLSGGGLNFNPNSQKVLLQAAMTRKQTEPEIGENSQTAAGEIPITKFKSNKLSQISKKARAEDL